MKTRRGSDTYQIALFDRCQTQKFVGEKQLSSLLDIAAALDVPVNEFCPIGCNVSEIEGALLDIEANGLRNGRVQVLLAGAFIDTNMTEIALGSLAAGFEAYLLSDFVFAIGRAPIDIHILRLTHAGCIPTTYSQILFQWATYAKREEQRLLLLKTLANLQSPHPSLCSLDKRQTGALRADARPRSRRPRQSKHP